MITDTHTHKFIYTKTEIHAYNIVIRIKLNTHAYTQVHRSGSISLPGDSDNQITATVTTSSTTGTNRSSSIYNNNSSQQWVDVTEYDWMAKETIEEYAVHIHAYIYILHTDIIHTYILTITCSIQQEVASATHCTRIEFEK